jgi:hypothetical protein
MSILRKRAVVIITSAVTTSPRPDGVSYLEPTLESLSYAGFDPLVIHDDDFRGSWPMLREALARLLERPGDALVVFQDDIVAAKWLFGWLEDTLWPGDIDLVGVCSLYTAGSNCREESGWYTSDELPVFKPWGACGLAFPRRSAEMLVANPPCKALLTGSDSHTATFCRMNGLKFWMHSPSLIQHVGAIGSLGIGDNRGLTEERCAGMFCGDVRELT